MNAFLSILVILVIIFLPIISFIIYSQKEYQLEDKEVIKLRISFSSYISIVNMFLMTYLSFSFLYVTYFFFVVNFSVENMFIGIVFLIFAAVFLIPVFNSSIHFLIQSRKEIYFFKTKKVLLIVEKGIESIIDLENKKLKIIHSIPNKSSKYQTNHGKYTFILDDSLIEISDMINFPDNIFEGSNFTTTRVKRLFIWI